MYAGVQQRRRPVSRTNSFHQQQDFQQPLQGPNSRQSHQPPNQMAYHQHYSEHPNQASIQAQSASMTSMMATTTQHIFANQHAPFAVHQPTILPQPATGYMQPQQHAQAPLPMTDYNKLQNGTSTFSAEGHLHFATEVCSISVIED